MAKIYYFLGHEQFQPEDLVKNATEAENAGFDGLFVSEHFNPWVADLGASGFAFATLGAIAAKTKKIELATGVVTPLFRFHPAVIAQAAATIDRLSNGRFTLGVGTGEAINEIALGYEFPKYDERSQRMVEALEIMEKLLNGKTLTFNGKYYKTKDAKLYSPPLHRVPIYMAAGGTKSAEIAAKYSDGIIVSAKNVDETVSNIVNPGRSKNKKLTLIATRWSVFAEDENDAWNALGAWRGLRVPGRDKAHNPKKLQQEADRLDKKEVLSKYFIVNSAKDYINAYMPLITRLHADIVVIQTTTGKNQSRLIKMLGEEVLPGLKKIR